MFPVQCDFQLRDPKTKQMISISSEGNGVRAVSQAAQIGDSVTVIPNEYVFQYRNTQINLIDTPGLMDTKDENGSHDTDKKHVNNILRLLSTYDEIHAICILLKGSVNRLSNTVKYTLNEIMTHLDKGASNNVIFILTHTTNAKSEETQSLLQRFMKENNLLIPLPPTKETIYCFDNDSVRYLAKCKNKIPPTEDDKEDAEKNWKRSARSTTVMFRYVCSLQPHSLARIKDIHNAEHTIGILSKLVLETLMCICKDEDDLQVKTKEAQAFRSQITMMPAEFARESLRDVLFIKESKVRRIPLGHTNIVCEGPICARIVNGERVYPQICCNKCKSKMLYWCSRIDWKSQCKVCGCGKDMHQWRNTETKIVTEMVTDESVIEKIVDSDSALREINKTISECEDRVKRYHNETEQMLRTYAKLNTFLHQNALLTPKDKLSDSLQNEIQAYESAGANSETKIKYLKQIQGQYNQFFATEAHNRERPHDVNKLIQELYSLPMKGNDLKKAMEEEEKARLKIVEDWRKSNTVISLVRFFEQYKSKASSVKFTQSH